MQTASTVGVSQAETVRSTMTGERVRLYEAWEGNEKFFCGGRLVAGPNWKSLLFTACLIIAPLVAYLVFVGRFLLDQSHFLVPLVTLVLGILALIFLFVTGCMDPGILPRQEPDEEYNSGRKPKTMEVPVNGHQVTVRYNETCHFYQPPRAHHCSVNDNCIEKFDHHCPWVGTTIGLRNYRFFLSFIFTASLLCIYVIATGVLALILAYEDLDSNDQDVVRAIEEVPVSVAVAGYCGLCFLFVGGLSFFHIYLVSTNQTTYENFRYGYDRDQNPYDEGCLQNCWSVWCLPIPKSRVKFRSFTQPTILPSQSQPPSTLPPPPHQSLTNEDPNYSTDGGGIGEVELGPYAKQLEVGSGARETEMRVHAGQWDRRRQQPITSRPYRPPGTSDQLPRPHSAFDRAPMNPTPPSEMMEIQIASTTESTTIEPPHHFRRAQAEGPEVRMFPNTYPEEIGGGESMMRPTSVPLQDGIEPRPRPRPATDLPIRPRF